MAETNQNAITLIKAEVAAAEQKVAAAEQKVAAAEQKVAAVEEKVTVAEEKAAAVEEKQVNPVVLTLWINKCQLAHENLNNAQEAMKVALEVMKVAVEVKMVAVEAKKWAVELQNALKGKFSKVFHQMMAESPVSKFTLQSIASAKSSAVYHWDFDMLKQVQQSDRKSSFCKKIAKHYSSFMHPDLCWCQISHEWGDGSKVAACHLLKHATAEHLKEQFEINDINDPKNVLMLCKGIEKAFESGRLYFVQGSTDREFYMKAWDLAVMQEAIYGGASKKIGDFVDHKLFLP